MKRIDAIRIVSEEAEIQGAALIGNIGYPSRELYAVGDRQANFYMLGSMGLASSIGLGLSLARPGLRVMAIDGDGSVLMNLGTLATIARHARKNYLLVILDNCCYGSTGSQPSCTAGCADLAGIARGAGVSDVREANNAEGLRHALAGSGALLVRVDKGNAPVPIIDLSPAQILERFSGSLPPSGSS
ncbi:MAG: sulfopyruvate decarboxylase subunit beta [Methanotrichaceae archaeon]|nr:sulfopyruvate decarboxylase subunit beta [Methanotrichaceae archaeon]